MPLFDATQTSTTGIDATSFAIFAASSGMHRRPGLRKNRGAVAGLGAVCCSYGQTGRC